MSTPEERLSTLEANEKSIFHQLDEVKEEIRILRDLTIAVEKLANNMQTLQSGQEEIRERIESFERAPAEDLRHYRRTVVTCLLSGALGAALSALAAMITGA